MSRRRYHSRPDTVKNSVAHVTVARYLRADVAHDAPPPPPSPVRDPRPRPWLRVWPRGIRGPHRCGEREDHRRAAGRRAARAARRAVPDPRRLGGGRGGLRSSGGHRSWRWPSSTSDAATSLLDEGLPVEAAHELDLYLRKNLHDARAMGSARRAASEGGIRGPRCSSGTRRSRPLRTRSRSSRLAPRARRRRAGSRAPRGSRAGEGTPPPPTPGSPQAAAAVSSADRTCSAPHRPRSSSAGGRTSRRTASCVTVQRREASDPQRRTRRSRPITSSRSRALAGHALLLQRRLDDGDARGATPATTFVTPPPQGPRRPSGRGSRRLGTADADAARLRDAYLAFTGSRGTDVWLMLGDNAYVDGTDLEYQAAVFNMYPRTAPHACRSGRPTETMTATARTRRRNRDPYYDIFTLPKNGEAGGSPSSTGRTTPSTTRTCASSVSTRTEVQPNARSAMLTWLQQRPPRRRVWTGSSPSGTTRRTRRGPTTRTPRSSSRRSRQNVLPLLEARGVDLVLGGHEPLLRAVLPDRLSLRPGFDVRPSNVEDGGDGRPSETVRTKTGPRSSAAWGRVITVAGSSGQAWAGSLNHPAMLVNLNDAQLARLDVNGTPTRRDVSRRSRRDPRPTFTIVKQPALLPVVDCTRPLSRDRRRSP